MCLACTAHRALRACLLTLISFVQGRVTDHRVGVTEHGIEAVLSGERLFVFIDALRQQHQADLLESIGT